MTFQKEAVKVLVLKNIIIINRLDDVILLYCR